MSETEEFKMIQKADRSWVPYCSICKRQVDEVSVTFGMDLPRARYSWAEEPQYTGIDTFEFSCHGAKARYLVDRRDPNNIRVQYLSGTVTAERKFSK